MRGAVELAAMRARVFHDTFLFKSKPRALWLLVFLLAAGITGCWSHKQAERGNQPAAAATEAPDTAPPPGPEAKIHISYAIPNDFLNSLVVTKYDAAEEVKSKSVPRDAEASIVRFQGGVVVWQIGARNGMLSSVPLVGKDKHYTPHNVKYGSLPAEFTQTVPESGPPEPLEPDHYYVFAVARGSGSTNYEAIKVQGDGSFLAYQAEPRAGTSFRLCCNVQPDFTVTAAAGGNSNAQ
jgi:hypothetical protein